MYCIVFVANSDHKRPRFVFDSTSVARIARKIKNDDLLKQTAQFTYLFANVQTDFAERLSKHSKLKSVQKLEDKVVILKRLDEKYVEFGWLDIEFVDYDDDDKLDWNQLLDEVKSNLRQLASGEKKLRFKMTIPRFYSEFQQVK